MSSQQTELLARRNDLIRTSSTPIPRSRIIITRLVATSPHIKAILAAIRAHDDFTPQNDPYREHDFATVEIEGECYFFKFDYFDADLVYGAANPLDPTTFTVMTIGHLFDY